MTVLTPRRPPAAPDTASDGGRRRRIPAGWRTRIGYACFVAALAYLVVVPLVRLQARAFDNDAHGYRVLFGLDDLGRTLATTAALAAGSVVIALLLGTLLAFAVSRLPSRWRFLRAVPVLPIVLPGVAAIIGWAMLLSPGPGYLNAALRMLPWWNDVESGPVDVYSVPWIIIITGFGLTSFVYLFVSAGLQNINSEHLEAAQTAGSTTAGVFFRIVLPLLRPSLVYGGGVALLLGLGQFNGPLLLGTNSGVKVLTTEMYRQTSEMPVDFAAAAAAGSPLVAFGLIVVFLQKVMLGNQTRFVTHGGKAFSPPAHRAAWAVVVVSLYGLLALVLPIVGLLMVAVSPYWSATFRFGDITFSNFAQLFADANITEAVVTSLIASIVAVAISIPIGFVAAKLLVHGQAHPVLRWIGDVVIALPLGIPAVIFGVGFLLTYTQPPLILYGTRAVIILVYVVLMVPFATRIQMTAMLSLGNAYTEASMVSGAGPLRTNLRITLPLMRPAILGSVALMFILLTHEFSASLLVRSPTTQVMGTLLYEFWQGNGQYPMVAAVALLMTAVTGVGVVIAMLLGGRDVLSKL